MELEMDGQTNYVLGISDRNGDMENSHIIFLCNYIYVYFLGRMLCVFSEFLIFTSLLDTQLLPPAQPSYPWLLWPMSLQIPGVSGSFCTSKLIFNTTATVESRI
jgi:hypothetical protein